MLFARTPARTLALLAIALGLPAAAGAVAAQAALNVEHSATAALENEAGADGIISPGDTIRLDETVLSSEPDALTGVHGTLSAGAGASVLQGSSPYPDLAFGATATNLEPFTVAVSTAVECGQNLDFALGLSASTGAATIPFTVGTGVVGAPQAFDSIDVPHAIRDGSTTLSNLPISAPGRVKEVRVRLARITHGYDGDLVIALVAPDGTRVVLVNRRGGEQDDFVNTVLQASGTPIGAGSPPFSGTYATDGDLRRFYGRRQDGTWRLEVTDTTNSDEGTLVGWGLDLSPATCVPQPIASFTATPNPVTPGGSVDFDGSRSIDPTGAITRYEWDLDGNGTFETDSGSTPAASHTYPTRSLVPVRLRITDEHGDRDVAMVNLSVTAPPVARLVASPVSPLTAQTTTLDGSTSSDSDGSIVRYQWDLDGDSSFEADTQATPTITTAFATPGTHTVRVRVTDDTGATSVAALDIVAGNRSPVAAFNAPEPAIVGQPATFDGSPSADPDGPVTRYEWDLDGDGTYETDSAGNATVQHTYAAAGTVTARLRVTDSSGTTAEVAKPVQATVAPIAALAVAPNPTRPNQPVAFSALGSSDPDGSIAKVEWDLDGDGGFERDTGTTLSTTHTYATAGARNAAVRLTDDAGARTVSTIAVDVHNDLPAVVFAAGPNPALTGQTVVFDATGTADPDGPIAAYQWDLDGNGSYEQETGTAPTAQRSYPNPATLTVRVRAVDLDGGASSRALTLVVSAPGGGGAGAGGGGAGTTPGSSNVLTPPIVGPKLPGAGSFAATLASAAIQPLKRVLRKGIVLTCRSDRDSRCKLTAQISAADARRLGLVRRGKRARATTVGTATVSAKAGRETRIAVKLSARVRRALKRKRLRSVLIVVRGAAVAGNESVPLSRAVLVRR